MNEENMELNCEGTELPDISEEEITILFSRIIEEVRYVSEHQLSKEEGGRRFAMALADFGKSLGFEDANPDDFKDDQDLIVVAEETMDWMVRLRKRLSQKTLTEIGEILERIKEKTAD